MLRLSMLTILFACGLCAQTYSVTSGSLFSFTPATAPTVVALGDNELSAVQGPSGFSFNYFGAAYSTFRIGSNGYIIMGSQGSTTALQPSHATAPGLVISPFWGDMRPHLQGQIGWTFASGKLTVEWLGVRLATSTAQGGPYNVQIQIILDTATGEIEFQYGDYGGFGIGPGSPWDYTCAISGPTSTGGGQVIVPGSDGSFVSPTGKISLWPLLRYVRFAPVTTPNNPPTIAVTALIFGTPLSQGQTVNASLGALMTTLNLKITVSDADGDDCSLAGSISNLTTQGILASEHSSTSAPVPYTLSPTTGQFNRAVVLHTFLLQASDGKGGTAQFIFYVNVMAAAGNSDPTIAVRSNGVGIGDGGTLNVAYGSTVAALNLQLDVDDPDGDATELGATISNVTTQGMLASEFANGHVAVPYSLAPGSGTFNQGGTTHQVVLTADDYRGGLFVFTFDIVVGTAPANNSPTLVVSANGLPLINGALLNVQYNSTLAALSLTIAVNDPDADAISVAGTVSNVGATGIVAAEFSSASAGVPYTLTPQAGTFSAGGTTHMVTLTAQDGLGGQATFTFSIAVGQAPGTISVMGGGGGGGCAAGGGAGVALLPALLLLVRLRRRPV